MGTKSRNYFDPAFDDWQTGRAGAFRPDSELTVGKRRTIAKIEKGDFEKQSQILMATSRFQFVINLGLRLKALFPRPV
jgi:hypothetical protein